MPSGFISSLNAQVEQLRFFESGQTPPPPLMNRNYATEFHSDSTRFIGWDLSLHYPAKPVRQSFTIVVFLYNPDGRVHSQTQLPSYTDAGWTGSSHADCWDFNSDSFPQGTYRISVFVDGAKIAAGSFVVAGPSEVSTVGGTPPEPEPEPQHSATPPAPPGATPEPPFDSTTTTPADHEAPPSDQGWHRFGDDSRAAPRVGGNVEQPRLLKSTSPRYPSFAKQAHVQGIVRLDALIDSDGRLRDIHVISGNPLLTEAAIQAVKEWIYQPGRLDGKVIEMRTEINLNFTLGQ